MYATDMLLRVGFLISHFNLFTVIVFIVSTGCYVYRAILEERFLMRQLEYRDYMKRVRYRFIPFVL
jgi:protein-S-isoprenylcysteine O-methyltransferase Ste14